MRLTEIVVAATTYLTGWFSWSHISDVDYRGQIPLLDLPTPGHLAKGPIFKPPTGSPVGEDGGDFLCDYHKMGPDWVQCTTPTDRTCWLQNTKTGQRFDIHTDYELEAPVGITRTYYISAADGNIDADGIPFPPGKIFYNQSLGYPEDPTKRYPGPWIQACWGDTVNVVVTNHLRFNGTTIHWHGVRQNQTFESDGVPGLTQCPVAPGDSMTYSFKVTQHGSSWYHSHYSLQYADGAAGPLTFHGPTSDNFDVPSIPLLMTDWGHHSAFYAIWETLGVQSTLLNGIGNVTRYNNTVQPTTEIPAPFNITASSSLIHGRARRYLLHLINVSFESMFVFTIDNHFFTVISTDFVSINPYNTTNVRVNIGQRYDIILIAEPINSTAKSFWIRCWRPTCYNANTLDIPSVGYEKAGIVYYDGATTPPSESVKGWPVDNVTCADEALTDLVPVVPWKVGAASEEEGNLTVNLNFGNPHPVFPLAHFSVGGPTFNPLQINYSHPMILNLTNTQPWQKKLVVYPENYTSNDWVYLQIENQETAGHPIHLHGHDFVILWQSNASAPAPPYKLNNPPRRDVLMLPPSGWVLIAFKTDNPGNWLIHCHIAQHASFGLAMQVLERQQSAYEIALKSGAIQRATDNCKKWDRWSRNCRNWWYDVANKTQGPGEFCDLGENWFTPDSGI